MKGVYKFHLDCGRQGSLNGVFVAEKEAVEGLIGKEIYFGEVLGKYSEVSCDFDESDYTLVSDNPEVVRIIEENDLTSGYNPFDYYEEEDAEEYEGQEEDEAEPEEED